MRFPVEIDVRMAGLAIQVISRVSPITIRLAMAGYLPLIQMPICNPINPRHTTLRISFVYWEDLIDDLNILSLMENTVLVEHCGDGSNTEE